MPPKFNRRRALFVPGKIDEILAWEQRKERERDTKFVELGRYLCGFLPPEQQQAFLETTLKCIVVHRAIFIFLGIMREDITAEDQLCLLRCL